MVSAGNSSPFHNAHDDLMTLGKDPNTLRVHLYVHHYGSPPVWVPYKILIGYGRGEQLIIDDVGEQLYSTQEFETREAAMDHARAEANNRIRKKFPHVHQDVIQWKIIEESAQHG